MAPVSGACVMGISTVLDTVVNVLFIRPIYERSEIVVRQAHKSSGTKQHSRVSWLYC